MWFVGVLEIHAGPHNFYSLQKNYQTEPYIPSDDYLYQRLGNSKLRYLYTLRLFTSNRGCVCLIPSLKMSILHKVFFLLFIKIITSSILSLLYRCYINIPLNQDLAKVVLCHLDRNDKGCCVILIYKCTPVVICLWCLC